MPLRLLLATGLALAATAAQAVGVMVLLPKEDRGVNPYINDVLSVYWNIESFDEGYEYRTEGNPLYLDLQPGRYMVTGSSFAETTFSANIQVGPEKSLQCYASKKVEDAGVGHCDYCELGRWQNPGSCDGEDRAVADGTVKKTTPKRYGNPLNLEETPDFVQENAQAGYVCEMRPYCNARIEGFLFQVPQHWRLTKAQWAANSPKTSARDLSLKFKRRKDNQEAWLNVPGASFPDCSPTKRGTLCFPAGNSKFGAHPVSARERKVFGGQI